MQEPLRRNYWLLVFQVCLCTLVLTSTIARATPPVESINLGAILPLSGSNAVNGRAAREGIELALESRIDDLQKQSLVVRIIYEDDQMSPVLGRVAAKRLIVRKHVPAILGPFSSPVLMAVALEAGGDKKTVIISGSATSSEAGQSEETIFRTVPRDEFHGRAIARFGYGLLRARKAGILFMDNAYGRGLKAEIEKEFSRLGGEIVIRDRFLPGQKGFREVLEKFKAAGIHCVFVPSYPTEGVDLVRQARALGITVPFLGGDGLFSSKLTDSFLKASPNLYATAPSWRSNSHSEQARAFVTGFREKYNKLPNVYSAYYFDTANLILDALVKGSRTSEEIRQFLLQNEFDGVTGTIRFDVNGEVRKPIDVFKVEQGQFEYFFTVQP